MTTIEELKEKFKVANVPGRGRCIFIPLDKFDPDWDQMILDAGFQSHAEGDMVYVILGSESAVEKESVAVEKAPKTWKKWTAEEDELLIELWNQKLTLDVIGKKVAEKFPKRTSASVKNRLGRLREAKKIEGRWLRKDRRKIAGGEKWTVEEDKLLIDLWNQKPPLHRDVIAKKVTEKFPKRVGTSVINRLVRMRKTGKIKPRWKVKSEESPATPIETEIPDPTKIMLVSIVEILHEHTQILDKLGCQALMRALEIKEIKGELVIPPNLWIHYANALLEDDKKFRDIFRSKVKLLLEVSK